MAKDRTTSTVRVISFVLHGGAFAAIAAISTGNVPRPIAVMMAEVVPDRAEATPPPPPPPVEAAEAPRERARARTPDRAPAPTESASSDSSADALPDYGIALAGVSAGPGGIAVPIGDPGGVRRAAGEVRGAPRVLVADTNDARRGRRCNEDEVPARHRGVRPVYSNEALSARVEGRVRVSVSIDERGNVLDAHALSSLGYGLDEAALDAVRRGRFEPATRCGEAVESTVVIGVRFKL